MAQVADPLALAPVIEVRAVSKRFGAVQAVDRGRSGDRARRTVRPHRPQWRGQEYALQDDARPVVGDQRRDPHRLRGRDRAGVSGGAAQDRLSARERGAVRQPHRYRDAAFLRRSQRRRQARMRRRTGARRVGEGRLAARARVFERHASAARLRPGAARQAADPVPRRTYQRPRPGGDPRVLCGAAWPARRGRDHDPHLAHPRRDPGAGRSPGDHQERQAAGGRRCSRCASA